ncbi:MAG: class I SAM-dependent methyltransferase [Bacteroidota bacterium]
MKNITIIETDIVERYERRLEKFGYSPEALGWGKGGRQELRFSVLADEALKNPQSSVLDVGCGFGDLCGYLMANGWQGRYTGIDIVPGLIEIAKKRNPNASFVLGNVSNVIDCVENHDYIISSGVFNAKIADDNKAYIKFNMEKMFRKCNICLCVDFMSTWVDYQQEGSWHTDPVWILETARSLSRRLTLRIDYMPYEFSIFVYKNAEILESSTYNLN